MSHHPSSTCDLCGGKHVLIMWNAWLHRYGGPSLGKVRPWKLSYIICQFPSTEHCMCDLKQQEKSNIHNQDV